MADTPPGAIPSVDSRKAILGAAALLYLFFIWRTAFRVGGVWHFTLFDDAMISMQYAKNFAAGAGLVWNAGEAPVEGYTNLLWTLWMALIHAAGVPAAKTSLIVSLSGIPILLLTGVASARLAARLAGGSAMAAAVALALVCFYYPLVFWSLRGTEVGAIALAVAAGAAAAQRIGERRTRRHVAAFASAAVAAILMRLDAVVAFAILAIAAVAARPRADRVQLATVLGGTLTMAAAAHFVFSLSYYSNVWPNTYYLKMTGVSLATRLQRGLLFLALVLLRHLYPFVAVAAIAFRCSTVDWRRDWKVVLAAVCAGQIAYSVWVGADAWESYAFANRYLAVALPLLLVLVAVGVCELADADRTTTTIELVRVLCVLTAVKLGVEWLLVAVNRNVDFILMFFYREHRSVLIPMIVTAMAALAAMAAVSRSLVPAAVSALARRGGSTALVTAFTMLVWLLANGHAFAAWLAANAPEALYDNRTARAGLLVNASTDRSAVIASARAGAFTYFADRRSIDFLGKADPIVARMAPVAVFKPGHDRWDYAASIDRGHPDVIGELWLPTADVFQMLASRGYVQLPNRLWVRPASSHVNVSALLTDIDGP